MNHIYFLQNCHIAVLYLLTTFIATGCSPNASNDNTGKVWQTQQVTTTDIVLQTLYSASIQGKQDIEIRPQVEGTITSVHITEGETVRKGQTLFIIDQVPYTAALNQAEAHVKAAEAALATAKLNHQSKQRLLNEKVISEHESLTAQNELLKAEAELAQAEANETNARNNLSYTVVKSPADGVVGILPFRQGALVSATISEPLTTLSDNSEMYVYFSMNESQILSLMRQYGSMDKAINNMDQVELLLNDGTLYPEKGKIESISGVVDRQTGSVTLRSKFPNDNRILLSGFTGNVQIPSLHKDIILIPQSATIKIQDKLLVYKVIDGKAQSTGIIVADDNDGINYMVLSGLNVGDIIISDGAGLVRDGMDIKTEE